MTLPLKITRTQEGNTFNKIKKKSTVKEFLNMFLNKNKAKQKGNLNIYIQSKNDNNNHT